MLDADADRAGLELRLIELSLRGDAFRMSLIADALDEMRARGCRVKPIGEILRFVGYQSFAEFHDAHRV